MRIDLTLQAGDGSVRDVAVLAPDGTCWADVVPALGASWRDGAGAWVGRERLRQDMIIGLPPLVSGAVVTTVRTPERRNGARLAVVGGLSSGREVPLGSGETVVGRDGHSALVFADARVSRRHAVFWVDRHDVVVRDLGSTHGTTVDGLVIDGPTVLTRAALVRIGNSFVSRSGDVDRPPTATEVVVLAPATAAALARPRAQLVTVLLPAAAGAGLAVALHSPMFLLFAALTPVTMLAGAGSERWHWRRSRRIGRARAQREQAAFEVQLARAVGDDAAARRAADPDPAALLRIAAQRSRRLWERVRDGPVGVGVRVGLGELPTRVTVEHAGRTSAADRTSVVPVCLDLMAGSVAVIAPQPVLDALARSMIISLATLYPPTDVEIAVVSSRPERWSWVRWLPHWHGVASAVDLTRHVRAPRTHLVVLIDGDDVGAVTVDAEVAIVLMSAVVAPRTRLAAQRIVVTDDAGAIASVEPAGAEPIEGVVLDGVSTETADALARSLAPLRARPRAAVLPEDCALVDLLGLDLHTPVGDIRARWASSDGRPRTVLGHAVDGCTITLDLAADGPHALVAGTTGSGKSELLQSLVIGLAVQHPPSRVTFLLIDYKGGAAFAACTELPHTVAVVTDLDDHLTTRVLASLTSEIVRRERVLAAAGVADIEALVTADNPLPRLVIVVDEFATLADELPGFVAGLVAVAQRGRSLGLHLVLATQRPAGVVSPEIRANTALRVCLRVTDTADSTDVLGSPEAAAISRQTPGRGYLRRGGELLAFQVGRVAAARRSRTTAPRVVELDGWRRLPPEPVIDATTDLDRLVHAVVEAGVDLPAPHRPWVDPLPHRLSAADVEQPADGAHSVDGSVPIGLVDRPSEQRREPLVVALGETLLVAGRPRSGRTTALHGIAAAFAARHSPSDLHIYAIDSSGDELRVLGRLPHVATIACATDGFDLTARLVDRLGALFAARRGAGGARDTAVLVLVDGWEQLSAAAEAHDGGRSADAVVALLRDAPAAGATVVVAGGRAALGARMAGQVMTRLLLALPDQGDYLLAGVDRAAMPPGLPGRGVRAADGAEFQIALPGNMIRSWPGPLPTSTIRLRTLPREIALTALPRPTGAGLVLGVGGDVAELIILDLFAAARRMLITGPAGSGRSSALCTLLAGAVAASMPVVVAAPPRSPLAAAAGALRIDAAAAHTDVRIPDDALVLVDDGELLTDTPLGASIDAWADRDPPGALVVTARSDRLALTFRGPASTVRAARCGLLLQPTQADGELLGLDLPRVRAARIAGRGLLVPDPQWHLGTAPLPLQVAMPP